MVNAGVTKVAPVNIGLPPVASAYHFTVIPAATLAVNVAREPGQIGGFVTVGGGGHC